MSLPQKLPIELMQTRWASFLDPLLSNPLVNGNFIKNVSLINGATVVNHLLGRQMQGWFITDINAAASVYRSAAMNPQTLTLTSNAACVVNLYCF